MNANQRKYRIIENYSLLSIDTVCVFIAYFLAFLLRNKHSHVMQMVVLYRVLFITVCVSLVYYALTNGGYRFFSRGYLLEFLATLKRSLVMFVVVGFSVYVMRYEKGYSRLMLGYFEVINFLLTYIGRILVKNITLISFKQGKKGDQILLITQENKIEEVLDVISKDEGWSYKISSIAITDKDITGESINGIPVVGSKECMSDIIKHIVFDVVFVYRPGLNKKETEALIKSVQLTGAMCHYAADLPAQNLFHIGTGYFASLPVFTYSSIDYDYRMRVLKRFMDVFGSFIGLVFTAVLTPFIALAIKIDSKGPVFFSQTRLSKNGRKFRMYKFRTMYKDAEARKEELLAKNEMQGNIFKMDNDPRVTKVGRFLRKTSLDELPQFWNVFIGDMSLVGTRPPTEDEFENYSELQKRRLSIRPGLTGLWQVSGRNSIKDFDEIVKLDLEYIDNWSLTLDIKILVKTIGAVFSGAGAT